jgi:hypothetical protein
MHIEPEDRLRELAVAPADLNIKYVIIDRPCQRSSGTVIGGKRPASSTNIIDCSRSVPAKLCLVMAGTMSR